MVPIAGGFMVEDLRGQRGSSCSKKARGYATKYVHKITSLQHMPVNAIFIQICVYIYI